MQHPSFGIIRRLEQSEFCQPNPALLKAFREQVWHMRVFIPGDQIDLSNRQVATHFSLNKSMGNGFPVLPVYLHEGDVVKAHGQCNYFTAEFDLLLLFAESNRADVHLLGHGEGILIQHEKLLDLRDMVDDGLPMTDDEVAAQHEAMIRYAVRARAYCSRHADVQMLHLGTLMTLGAKRMLVGALSADRYARHAEALNEINMEILPPGWRFMLLEEARGHAAMIRDLRKTPPCYLKIDGQGWWKKFRANFESPPLPLIGLKLT
jgi:hypothetical protein